MFTILNHSIVWPGGSTTQVSGTPECGWDDPNCEKTGKKD